MIDVLDFGKIGTYVLNELDQEDNVTYIINGGTETNQGIVEVKDNANQVKMINAEQQIASGQYSGRKICKGK